MVVVISTMCFPGKPTGAENVATAAQLLDVAGERRSDIACLPETFTHRHGIVAEDLAGPAVTMAREKARQHHMFVIAPIVETHDGTLRNSSVLVDRNGAIAGTYWKVHPTSGERARGIVPGHELPVFETDFGRIAILTCFDHDWPEMFGAYRRKGARVIFWPTMVYGSSEFANLAQKGTTCLDHGLYLVASNYYYGSDPAPVRDYRHTFVMSPEGIPLVNASYRPGVLTAYVDLDFEWRVRDASDAEPRSWFDMLEPLRRPDLYRDMLAAGGAAHHHGDAPRRRVRAAAVNLPEVSQPDPAQMLTAIDRMLGEAHGAAVAVLPENCLFGGAAEEQACPPVVATAEQIDALAGLARRHELHLVAPVYEWSDGHLFAASLLFDRRGEIVARYRKTHLSRIERDVHGVRPGPALPVFRTELGAIALLLGRDLFYPEAYAVLTLKGAELILWSGSPYRYYPTAYQMRHLLMARPLTYVCGLVASMYGADRPHPSPKLQRTACVVDEFGQVRADTGPCPGVATAELGLPPRRNDAIAPVWERVRDQPEVHAAAWQ